MLRKKRQVKGLAAIGLAGIMAASLGLAGCGKYESSSEMKARMESDKYDWSGGYFPNLAA